MAWRTSPPQAAPRIVLIVEDDPLVSRIIVRQLQRVGYLTRSAACIEDARSHLVAQNPDLIILDLHLPDGHGFVLLRELRSAGREVPVILMTGVYDEEVMADGLVEYGADDFLKKPLNRHVLEARFAARVRRHPTGTISVQEARPEQHPPMLDSLPPPEIDCQIRQRAAALLTRSKDMTVLERDIIRHVLVATEAVRNESALASAVGASTGTLRRRWSKALGSRERTGLKQFIIWGRRLRVFEMARRGSRASLISVELQVDDSTVYRDLAWLAAFTEAPDRLLHKFALTFLREGGRHIGPNVSD